MFERFTDRARTVVVLAQEEARTAGSDHIGTEHLLLGLLAEGHGVAASVLKEAGLSLGGAREEVERAGGRSGPQLEGNIPFTPQAKKALENSLRECLNLRGDAIDTQHILLGVAADREGVAAQMLESKGLSLGKVREAVGTQLMASMGLPVGPWRGRGPVRQQLARGQNTTPAVAELYLHAREIALGDPVSSAHMLRALAGDPKSRAARALAALGVTPQQIEEAVAQTPVEGTSDETAEDAIARIVSIHAEDTGIEIHLADPDLANLLKGGVPELSGPLARSLDDLRRHLERAARKSREAGGASMGE